MNGIAVAVEKRGVAWYVFPCLYVILEADLRLFWDRLNIQVHALVLVKEIKSLPLQWLFKPGMSVCM